MDLFNTKKLAALEARIAKLEPTKHYYEFTSTTSSEKVKEITVADLDKRLKAVEEEVGTDTDTRSWMSRSFFRIIYDDAQPEKLTLRKRVERICEHLKIQFVTEPQRTVLKPVKAKKA